MAKTTGTETFFSKSTQIGSTRWQFALPPLAPRGYLLDMSFQRHLPSRWYSVALVNQGGAFSFAIHTHGADADASLEEADLQAILQTAPVFSVPLNTSDEALAIERLERVVSNVMHNLLEPSLPVAMIWARFATTDGTNAYRP